MIIFGLDKNENCFDVAISSGNFRTIQKLKKKHEEMYMSVVGIVLCKDGVLAFSDSKSSLNYKPEPGRTNIPKIFHNDKIILCNYGYNRIDGVPIEEIIPRILTNDMLFDDFIKIFNNEIVQKQNQGVGRDYHFLVYNVYNGQCIKLITFEQNKNPIFLENNEPMIIAGNEYYVNVVSELLLQIPRLISTFDITVLELSSLIKDNLEIVINILDTTGFNNPCGLPIVTKGFKVIFPFSLNKFDKD